MHLPHVEVVYKGHSGQRKLCLLIAYWISHSKIASTTCTVEKIVLFKGMLHMHKGFSSRKLLQMISKFKSYLAFHSSALFRDHVYVGS